MKNCSHKDGGSCEEKAGFTGDDDRMYCPDHIWHHSELNAQILVECSCCSNKVSISSQRARLRSHLPNYCRHCRLLDKHKPCFEETIMPVKAMGMPTSYSNGEDNGIDVYFGLDENLTAPNI